MTCIDKENLLKDLITIYAPMQEQKDILVKCIKKVNEQPTADVEEVKHGEWLLDGRCSECLANPLTTHKSYCPHCGAKMDGGKEE